MVLNIRQEYNKLMSYSTVLYNLYNQLVRLELQNKCDFPSGSSEVIRDIIYYQSLEKCSYDLISTSNNDLMSLLLYINDNIKIDSKMFNVDDIINLESNDIVKRILYNIQCIILGRRLSASKEKFSYYGNMMFVNYKMLNAFDDDLLLAFLNVNQDKVLKEQDFSVRERFIRAKYNTIFLNGTFDRQMLRNNYTINMDNIFVANNFVLSMLGIDRNKIIEIQNSYFTNIVNNQIDRIMFYNENEINSFSFIKSEVEIRNSILIAALLLLGADVKNRILQDLFIKKSRFYESISSKNVFDQYILTGFQQYDNFEPKIKIVSL